jgi:imidazolonepropionase-like amidohydrolase
MRSRSRSCWPGAGRLYQLVAASAAMAAACASAARPAAREEARVERREVIMQTRKSGASVTTYHGDGSIEFDFQYVENGRGPRMKARAELADDGTLRSYAAEGLQQRGLPIHETFAIEGGRARWKSLEESGEVVLDGPAFYVPMAAPPELMGLLFSALSRHGGELRLLPGGVARLEREREITVKSAAGEEKKLVAWAMTGLDLLPVRVFAELDGTYFGVVDEWFSCLPDGWAPAIAPLLAAQNGLQVQRDRAMAARLARRPPAAGVAFVHARVLDIEKRRWLADHTVVVVDGRIAALGPSSRTRPPEGAEVIDAGGRALLPGLWNMHTHSHASDGPLAIAAGVTTVRDLGNDIDRLDEYKKAWDEGTAIGPRLFRSGFIEGRGANAASSAITAETEAEARAAVEAYAARGYEGIKIYNSVKPELVPLLARLAHEKGMRVSGHVPAFMNAESVIRAGYDELQHMNMVFLNFLADEKTDTRTHLRVSLVAEKAGELDLSSPRVERFIQLLLDRKTVLDPTMYVWELLFVSRPGEILPGLRELVARLPVQAQRSYRMGGLPVPAGKEEAFQRSYRALLTMLKKLHDAGVPIVAGTDAPAGLAMQRELEIYAEAGLSPADVIYTATLGPARVMKRERTSGSIAVGKDADLILVDGDPLADIRALRKVVTTMRGGVMYSTAQVYESLGIRP